MKMWILDDSHFPTGFANGKIKESYPEYLKLYINCRRYDIQGPIPQARIDLRNLKGRIWDKPETDVTILGVYLAKRLNKDDNVNDPIDEDTLIDITHQMNVEKRLLTLDVPAGAYSIFVVFETHKGMEETTKDYLNPLVKEATQVLLDEVYQPHYDHYKDAFGKTILGFFSDEPRFGNAKGTACSIGKDMPLPWRKGLEKELHFDLKYLPLLWTKGKGKESEIRFVYMDLITLLYQNNFTQVLADWCNAHAVMYLGHTIEDNGAHARLGYGTGHYFRGQKGMDIAGVDIIGTQIVPGMNYHHDAFSTGGSNGEFYHYALAKLGTSAAHLDAKKKGRTMCEAFGAYGWNEGLKTMKWIADSLIVRGVNYLVPHAFNPKEFPDWDCPPHFYAHGHNPQFRYFSTFDSYLNRLMSIFREGHYPSKVGLFYPAETEWSGAYMPIEKPTKELTTHQVSFDIVTRDYLKEAKINSGSYSIHNTSFEVLIMPYGECICGDMINVLHEMIQNQIKLIFIQDFPGKVLGLFDEEKWEEIKKNSQVVSLCDCGKTLQSYQPFVMSHEEKDLVVGEYIKENKHFYMLFNESVEKTIEFDIQWKKQGNCYSYDAWEDKCYRVTTNQVTLTPYQSLVYVITDEELNAEAEKGMNVDEVVLPNQWEVFFADSFSYPNFNELVDLHSLGFAHTIEGFEEKAGTLRYQSKLQISSLNDTILDLGNVFEIAEVFINGHSLGVKVCKPYVFDCTPYLQMGENVIAIEITNTLGTQIRDALSHYLPIEPFGIEGPVKLKIKK